MRDWLRTLIAGYGCLQVGRWLPRYRSRVFDPLLGTRVAMLKIPYIFQNFVQHNALCFACTCGINFSIFICSIDFA